MSWPIGWGDEPAHLDLRELADQALAHSSVRHVDVVTRPDFDDLQPADAVVRITTDDALTSTGFDLVAPLGLPTCSAGSRGSRPRWLPEHTRWVGRVCCAGGGSSHRD